MTYAPLGIVHVHFSQVYELHQSLRVNARNTCTLLIWATCALQVLLLCERCSDLIKRDCKGADPRELRFLEEVVWAEVPLVVATAKSLLKKVSIPYVEYVYCMAICNVDERFVKKYSLGMLLKINHQRL